MRTLPALYESSVGKKITMAVSGILLIAFVVAHMIGNLKVYQGREAFNHYAEGLRIFGAPFFAQGQVLWIVRAVLLLAVAIHIVAAIQLTLASRRARRAGYRRFESLAFSYASRTMVWGGLVVLLFVAYHLMHLTFGNAHPDFVRGDAYHNFITGFRSVPVSVAYIAAMVPLGLHLYHGTWSLFQTLGANNPRYNRFRRPFAAATALAVVVGNVSFPLAVLAGLVG